jgi:hypothetical protein
MAFPLIPILGGIGMLAAGLLGRRGQDREPLSEQIPDAPRVGEILRPPGEELISEQRAAEEAQLSAQQADQARAMGVRQTIEDQQRRLTGDIEAQRTELSEQQEAFQAGVQEQQERLEEIPAAVQQEFTNLRKEFDVQAGDAFERVEGQRAEALAEVHQGQSAAMQAAVQGIQGTINQQVSQINANPDLTDAQRTSMIAQVRMQGAMSLAPAVGQTVHQFTETAANVHTQFGAITGQIQTQVLAGQVQLLEASGNAFAQAQNSVGQMTNQLLDIEANANNSYANSQNQLLATRSMAENASNDLMLRLLPEMSTPYADFTGSAATRFQFEHDIMMEQFQMQLQQAGMNIHVAMLQSMQGNPLSNMLQGALGGMAQFGGMGGALMGGLGGLSGSLGAGI